MKTVTPFPRKHRTLNCSSVISLLYLPVCKSISSSDDFNLKILAKLALIKKHKRITNCVELLTSNCINSYKEIFTYYGVRTHRIDFNLFVKHTKKFTRKRTKDNTKR